MSTKHQHNDWRTDPRLNSLSPERLQALTEMADDLKHTPQNQKLSKFLSIQKKLSDKGLSFQDAERELLISVLSEELSSEERKKLEMIRRLSAQMHRKSI